jgi:hypothetical protein
MGEGQIQLICSQTSKQVFLVLRSQFKNYNSNELFDPILVGSVLRVLFISFYQRRGGERQLLILKLFKKSTTRRDDDCE